MAAGTSDPYIYFKHAQLAKDLGYKSVNTQEYQYLVLRVRGAGLTGGIFPSTAIQLRHLRVQV